MFGRIRSHEKMREEGVDPVAVARAAKEGTYEDDMVGFPAAKRARQAAAAAAAGATAAGRDDEVLG